MTVNIAASVNAVPTTQKGALNGVAVLDATGNVPASELGNAPAGGGGLAPKALVNVLQYGPLLSAAQDGTYPKTAGGTQALGDGSATKLSVVYTSLANAQVVYPFATSLTQTVDYCAFQLALNTLASLTHPTAATLYIPRGQYDFGNSLLVPTQPNSNAQITMEGQNGWISQPDYGGATILRWQQDVTGAPHMSFAIDATQVPRFTMKNLSMLGPTASAFTSNNGVLACVLAGVRVQGQSYFENVSISCFSTGIGYGGGVAAGYPNTVGFDHSSMRSIWMNHCGYGVHMLPGSTSAGDQHFYDLHLDCDLACFAIAASGSSGLVGSNITGAGLYSPIGFYLYDDTTHAGAQILGNTFDDCSCEQSYNASVLTQRLQNPGGGTFAKNHINYLFQGPHPTLKGWGDNEVCTSAPAGATGNQVAVNVTAGFVLQTGMAISDTTTPARIPANTTVTAISGWTWPGTTATLTLSNNLTADPTGDTLLVLQPKGNIRAFNIHDNVAPTYSSQTSGYAVYNTPSNGSINDNQCFDSNQTLTGALNSPLCSGPAFNTTWGNPNGTLLGSGILSSGVSCTAGDLLMFDAAGSKLVLCDNSRPPVGAALLTTAAGGNVDYYIRADAIDPATVRNRTGVSIAAGALLKPDAANPGGVTTASSPNDGFIVGYNNASAITAGSSGTIAQIKC